MLLTRTAIFASPLGERLAFYSMTGREALGQLFSYEVDLLASEDSIDLSELLGQNATIVLERSDGSLRHFNGFVTQFSLIGEHGNFTRYRATLHPWLWFLSQKRNSRIFQRKSVPEIAQQLFREHGMSDFEIMLSGDYRIWDYLVQYRESDLNFVSRVLEQEGIYYFFKHADGKHKLVLADSSSAHEAAPGYETVPYFPPMAREQRQQEHLDSWTATRQIRQGVITLADFNFETPSAYLGAQVSAPLGYNRGEYDIYDYPAEVTLLPEAESQARIRLEEHQADFEVLSGTGPVRGLMAGNRFALSQYPREDQNRDYLVVNASYEIHVTEFESNVVQDEEPEFRFQLAAIDAKRPYRAPRITPKPRVEGPQTAIVVGDGKNADIWTDVYGRVKVKFHWVREEQPGDSNEEQNSCWVRVSQAWAGKGWGSMHIPRVDQEVIVDFLEGDPDRPIITGRVYNAEQTVPYGLPVNATQSGIKSRSTPDGGANNYNELRFEDKKGEEELHIQAEKTMSTLVKKDRSASVGGSDSVSVSGDRSVSVNGNLSVSVKGNGSGPTQSTHSVTGKHLLDATDEITVKAPNKITFVCGGSSITMTPDRIVVAAGGGGGMVIDFVVNGKSKGGGELMLDANAFLKGNGNASLFLSDFFRAESAAGTQLAMNADATLTAKTEVKIEGLSVTATGQMDATLKGGAGSVQCQMAGTTVGGPNVNVNGDAQVGIAGPLIKIG
jgi:type VI secretion system secreted protein VgrG